MKPFTFKIGLVFVLGFKTMFAQTSAIVINNENNINFKTTINNIIQHQEFSSNVKITRLKSEAYYAVKIDLENNPIALKKRIYIVDEGLTQIYTVNSKGINLKKIVPSATQISIKELFVIPFIENEDLIHNKINENPNLEDTSSLVKVSKEHYKMPNYNGKIGCPWPLKEELFRKIKDVILSKEIEDDKFELGKEKVQEIDSVCLTTFQTIELLTLFEYEETKLDFAKLLTNYLFDLDNIDKLKTVFNFENSIIELKNYINKN